MVSFAHYTEGCAYTVGKIKSCPNELRPYERRSLGERESDLQVTGRKLLTKTSRELQIIMSHELVSPTGTPWPRACRSHDNQVFVRGRRPPHYFIWIGNRYGSSDSSELLTLFSVASDEMTPVPYSILLNCLDKFHAIRDA